jgi:hypothetical protein
MLRITNEKACLSSNDIKFMSVDSGSPIGCLVVMFLRKQNKRYHTLNATVICREEEPEKGYHMPPKREAMQ